MSLFADFSVMASATIDEVYGEAFVYIPMTRTSDVNASPMVSPDIDRPVKTITAAYMDKFARAISGPARVQGVRNEMPGHATDRPFISIDKDALPYEVRTGDRIKRVKTGAVYQLAEPRRDDMQRTEADLTVVK